MAIIITKSKLAELFKFHESAMGYSSNVTLREQLCRCTSYLSEPERKPWSLLNGCWHKLKSTHDGTHLTTACNDPLPSITSCGENSLRWILVSWLPWLRRFCVFVWSCLAFLIMSSRFLSTSIRLWRISSKRCWRSRSESCGIDKKEF